MATPPPADGSGGAGAQRVLGDLIEIPEAVHDGDLVFKLGESAESRRAQAIAEYVVTPQLATCFEDVLATIKGALAQNQSRATYLNGSFGSGKSHFMAVLSGILDHDPAVRGKERLGDILSGHDDWLPQASFIEVKSHLVDEDSLEAAILGGYVRQVRKEYPDAPIPAVYRADGMLADAAEHRRQLGDEAFIAQLPATESASADADSWGNYATEQAWTSDKLDRAFAVAADTADRSERNLREDLISALLAGPFQRFTGVVHGAGDAFISLDEGLSVVSRHAKEHLGKDAVIMLLDELILRFTRFIGDEGRVAEEVQKVAKLIESSASERPAPIVSFVPRQADVRDLVGLGGGTEGVSSTIKYWDGRFDHVNLADSNLTEVVRKRLLAPKDEAAAAEIATAFERMRNARPEVKDTLLDVSGGEADTWEDFQGLYPFSPAVLHVMVDLSAALQRQRSALKLMLELLVRNRTTLQVGQLVPMGAVFDVLVEGEVRPFKDQLSAEYDKIRNFYRTKVLPWLLERHGTTEEEVAGLDVVAPFRREDLLVKTLLLATLVPNVPALKELTASRLIALNHGIIKARRTNQDVHKVAEFFKTMSGQFGEVRVGEQTTNPTIALNLLRVDTESLMRSVLSAANDHDLRRAFQKMLWEELGLQEGANRASITWRGTQRTVELVFGNIRDPQMGREQFQPEGDQAVRLVIDYPFDDHGHNPADDYKRIEDLQDEFPDPPATLAWVPHFLSEQRIQDARRMIMMERLLEPNAIEEKAPDWSSEDRRDARMQLDNQRAQLAQQLKGLLRGAYGLTEPNDTDYNARAHRGHLAPLLPNAQVTLEAGSSFPSAMERIMCGLLDNIYPEHPDFSAFSGKTPLRRQDLSATLKAVEQAKGVKLQNYTPEKTDLPVLRRVANPLDIAQVSEVFVLRGTWTQRLDKLAGSAQTDTTDIRVRDLKAWIRETEKGHGLTEDLVDLIVQVYAIETDRAWLRGGARFTDVAFGRLHGDIVLHRQALPSEEEFDRANERAAQLFGLARAPLRNAAAVQRMAEQLKGQMAPKLGNVGMLVAELEQRADLLHLDDDSPRLRTARVLKDLIEDLRDQTDDTALVSALGRADLPGDLGVYKASLDGAYNLAQKMQNTRWEPLEALVERAGDPDALGEFSAEQLTRLRSTAYANDTQQARLATVLDHVVNEAMKRLLSKGGETKPVNRTGTTTDPGGRDLFDGDGSTAGTRVARGGGIEGTAPESGPPGDPGDTAVASARLDPGQDAAALVQRLREQLGIDDEAAIEITVRVAE
ncbi:phage resistance protein [Nocardiopsis suaedae]|uniref:Phage resistance protein n=1 Tax=Nocardiopsis suaedae TaxID=3018444 RepID=A0ABT4TPL4_9ACTN|nr:phage resistance protein [Nocardiopsis suaedae]MDA2806625.1 phage resistance protein [Nocardiopsis suaedae]